MFKGVILGRNWPDTGMTSKKWLDVPLEWVNFNELIMTQEGVYFRAILDDAPPVGRDPHPHIIRWKGLDFVEDGHTRIIRAMLYGQAGMLARVLDIDS